jgi:ADP-ribosylarginine hydrolase
VLNCFQRPEQVNSLVEFAVESGRMTHHHPIGYLGGVAAALMISYAIQNVPIKKWAVKCLDGFELAREYIKRSNHCVDENLKEWSTFIDPWKRYMKMRDIENGENEPVFPEKYGVRERDEFYKTIFKTDASKTWAGSNGLDSVLIAYDGLLGCKGDWKELCLRAMLHGGDNDTTGCIAGSFYGILYGFQGVPENNYQVIRLF